MLIFHWFYSPDVLRHLPTGNSSRPPWALRKYSFPLYLQHFWSLSPQKVQFSMVFTVFHCISTISGFHKVQLYSLPYRGSDVEWFSGPSTRPKANRSCGSIFKLAEPLYGKLKILWIQWETKFSEGSDCWNSNVVTSSLLVLSMIAETASDTNIYFKVLDIFDFYLFLLTAPKTGRIISTSAIELSILPILAGKASWAYYFSKIWAFLAR